MIHGPSAGPAMVLNLLMRWPMLIPIIVAVGVGAVVYKHAELPEGLVMSSARAEAPMVGPRLPPNTSLTPPTPRRARTVHFAPGIWCTEGARTKGTPAGFACSSADALR